MFEVLAGALILVGFGALMVLSGRIGFWWARRRRWPAVAIAATSVVAAIEWPFVFAWRYFRWGRTVGWLGVLFPEISHRQEDHRTREPMSANTGPRTGPNLGRPPTPKERARLRKQLGRE